MKKIEKLVTVKADGGLPISQATCITISLRINRQQSELYTVHSIRLLPS